MSNLDAIYDYYEDKFTSWNPVMNFVMELKYRYFGYFGKFDYCKSDNMVEFWANALNEVGVTKYADVLKYVKVVEHCGLSLFKYNSIAVYNDDTDIALTDLWSMYDGFYRECRGVVVDIRNDELVIAPYAKFFNLNELEETMYDNIVDYMNKNNLTTKDLEFTEKIDGCIICARWYHDELVVSASGSLDTKINPVIGWATNYIKNHENYLNLIRWFSDFLILDKSTTFMFECICPLESHVVEYDDNQHGLYLIGMRNIKTGFTHHYDEVISMATAWRIPTTTMYKDYTLDHVISKMDDAVGTTHEGFVMNIKHKDGFRVKIKYSDYVQLASIIDGLSKNKIVKYVYNDELDDIKSILRTKNKLIVLDELEKCEATVNEYISTYNTLFNIYTTEVRNMAENGCKIAEIMKYIMKLDPKYVRGDVINAYKGLDVYMKNPYYQLTKQGSRNSKDIGYLTFNNIVDRLEEMKTILQEDTVIETLERNVDHEL